jgi:hypothetical protein
MICNITDSALNKSRKFFINRKTRRYRKMEVIGVMVARVKEANEAVLHSRRNVFKRKHGECRSLSAFGAQTHLHERAMAELGRMEHPIFDAYALHPVGWDRRWRPRTKEQAATWVSAIRRGILPEGAYVVARPGSDLLKTGDTVNIMFTK